MIDADPTYHREKTTGVRIDEAFAGRAGSRGSTLVFRRWVAPVIALLVSVGCAGGGGIDFENSRYDDIAVAARYAARCRVHQPGDQIVRIERVHYESGSYSAFILTRDENAVLQTSCDSRPQDSAAQYSFGHLINRSRGTKGDYFIGQAYSDGTTYFVRSLPNEIDLATYEPNRGRAGIEPNDLLRQWADTADALFEQRTAN